MTAFARPPIAGMAFADSLHAHHGRDSGTAAPPFEPTRAAYKPHQTALCLGTEAERRNANVEVWSVQQPGSRHWLVALLLPAFVAATSYGIAAVGGVLTYPRFDIGADSVINGALNLLAGLVIRTLFALTPLYVKSLF